MYVRLHKGTTVDAVVPSSVGVAPNPAPNDVILCFPSDINPSKTIQVTENVQAADPVTGELLFNADGTPQWETTTVTNPDGTTSEQIVTQQVNQTVTLLESPSSFVLADLSGYTIVGSAAHQQAMDIAALESGLAETLANGFVSKQTGHTYVTTVAGQSNMEGELKRFQLDSTLQSVQFFTVDAGWQPHTLTQLQQAFVDGGRWKDAQYAQLNNLIAQVKAGTEGVTWTPASY